jgi:REP element-mobilizing transposase RayT
MAGNFDPAKHHRRSIRLKGHNYAGGGLYFVTLCAHRDAGNIFASEKIKAMIAREWESAAGDTHKGCPYGAGRVSALPYIIMPDHFHALIRIPVGAPLVGALVPAHSLGDVIGAFKSRVVHEMIQMVHAGLCPPFPGKIWHRNYYERIVRTPEAAENIRRYIRMNPWKCIQNFGNGQRGMGNPVLWNTEKIGVLCSRVWATCMSPRQIPEAEVYLGGFHSPPEQKILENLLKRRAKIIYCPAWGLENVRAEFIPPLEENRMLILEMCMGDTHVAPATLASAEQRNRFVIQNADKLWIPHISKGGMLDRLLQEINTSGKLIS